jgi:hypothetical protein
MTVNSDTETVWEEAVVTYFVVLSQHLTGQTEENYLSQDSQGLEFTGLVYGQWRVVTTAVFFWFYKSRRTF